MDPLTAALNLANTVAEIILEAIKSQPPEVRAAFAVAQLEELKRWQAFLDKLAPRAS